MTTLGMTAMNKPIMTTTRRLLLAAILSATVSPAFAVEYYLSAQEFTKAMPDGTSVTMWGYAEGTLNGDNTVTYGAATVPGPQLVVPPGDTTLTIHLVNALPQLINGGDVPTSMVMPGQTTTMLPVKFTVGPFSGRVRSFTHETAATTTLTTPGPTSSPAPSCTTAARSRRCRCRWACTAPSSCNPRPVRSTRA
jgi:FtsP/CotA-like multicopper oxidase with cupredoxin domain